jgi:AraC family transcriptional regulator, arabinose operon regulatory protein
LSDGDVPAQQLFAARDGPAFGAMVAVQRDRLYLFRHGFIFTSAWVKTTSTVRYPGVLLLCADGSNVRLDVDGCVMDVSAAVIAPRVRRGLWACQVPLLSVHVEPSHPQYAAFCALPGSGVQALGRSSLDHLNPAMHRCFEGQFALDEANELFDALLAEVATMLPTAQRCDGRLEQVFAALDADPHCRLQSLAQALNLSYHRMSHVFAQQIGLPLKSYQLWRKVKLATMQFASDASLTEIAHAAGFADSAHLSRSFAHFFGIKPSYLVNSDCVQVVC